MKGKGVPGHSLRSTKNKYPRPPYSHYQCQCGKDFGRMSEADARPLHLKHVEPLRKDAEHRARVEKARRNLRSTRKR